MSPAGLTLVRANHVFLLEPSIDPSIEQQAISRVHRIGQQRPVHIMRLAVKGTIEEHILKLQKHRQNLFQESDTKYPEEEEKESEEEGYEDPSLPEIAGGSTAATTLPNQAKNETLSQNEIDILFNAVLQE